LGVMGSLPSAGVAESSVWPPASAINPPAPGSPHDEFRGMHHDYWRSDDDCVMTFVSRVLVPSAIRNKTSGGGEEGENAGK
jgi:hypothetical protein